MQELNEIVLVAALVRAEQEVPIGILYAHLQSRVEAERFLQVLEQLEELGLVEVAKEGPQKGVVKWLK